MHVLSRQSHFILNFYSGLFSKLLEFILNFYSGLFSKLLELPLYCLMHLSFKKKKCLIIIFYLETK